MIEDVHSIFRDLTDGIEANKPYEFFGFNADSCFLSKNVQFFEIQLTACI